MPAHSNATPRPPESAGASSESSEQVRSAQEPVAVEPQAGPQALPVEIPLSDEPGGTQVDLKTQIIRFVLTGGLSAVVDFGLYVLLLKVVGLPVDPAKAIGFIAGTTTAYLINRRWTFQAPPSRARFIAVVVLYAVTFAVQVGLNGLVYGALDEELWWRVPLAFVVAQGTATVINFVVQRVVIFKLR
ncbi:GtrA family protein [Nocardia paucivorans]|uniref:GtrA family protein n=1 Tax=Nocardia paucivorans TaxID=114259 RepID=UPI0002DA3B7E|nr:GtrA family protein [Nocardia paucivorans]